LTADSKNEAAFGQLEEVATAVLYLCSLGAAFITGAALPVDGGALA
jgi:NAD(P)-dependent dehydrogenase (short-subunit alcohol dehydrogenase family)